MSERRFLRVRRKGTALRHEAAVRFLAQAGPRDGVHDEAGLIAELGRRSPGDQFHRLNRVQRDLRGESLALLVADRLPIHRKAGLRMIPQRMKETVGIGSHGSAAQHHGVAHARARRRDRKLGEARNIHVVVGVGNVLQKVRAVGFHGNGLLRSRDHQRNLQAHRHGTPNVDVLRGCREIRRAHLHVIRIRRNIGQAECALAIRGGGLLVVGDAIENRDLRARQDCAPDESVTVPSMVPALPSA